MLSTPQSHGSLFQKAPMILQKSGFIWSATERSAGEPTLFLHALFLLLSLHYACNLEYMKEPVHDVHFF